MGRKPDEENLNASCHHLLRDSIRISVEQLVSEYLGREWRVKSAEDKTAWASHLCAILSDGSYPVFIKMSEAAFSQDQVKLELHGLHLLTELSGILTPSIIGSTAVEGGSIMILEAVQAVDRELRHWRQIGQTLARIHQVKWDRCGLETHGYFGPLLQDNRPITDWPTFYAERRLLPRLKMAVDSGRIPLSAVRQMNKLIARLPQLCGPMGKPSLLHGDAQQNNFISTEGGTVVIDPAVYFGNPEMDLALVDYFQPVPDEVFKGYQDVAAIDPGFYERRDLWRISGWLACVIVDGSYLDNLISAIQKYL